MNIIARVPGHHVSSIMIRQGQEMISVPACGKVTKCAVNADWQRIGEALLLIEYLLINDLRL